ncbi:hypothetical protein E4100_00490 [Soehngenia longivitae]|uniref:Uncharacterized protein n=1 Tax=Soehngenia longivitae TaxID=2562294 RepID=A0A4Z0D9Q7_9FIRM|nr:hypothetical protein [Soehngenia longivitae]TFZ41648.1 hypothetical protein E4100_00490 [Soehngenia longivitae]
MKAELKPKFHNRFDIVVTNVETGEVELRGQAENIVLNRMYTRLVAFGSFFTQIVFGTGSGTLDPTRTTLFNRVGNKACSDVELIRAFPVSKWTRFIRLEATEFNGNILTEVGISEASTEVNTHAMITDAEGNPLSIEKTPVRIIDIYATVFVEFDEFTNGGEWYTTLRDYLAGAGSVPSNTLAISTSKYLCQPNVGMSATATTDAVARTRKLNCQFSNYVVLGIEATGNRYFGKTFKDRKLDIPVDRLVWAGIGSFPVSYDGDMTYEYVVSSEEAAANKLFLNFKDTNVEEVKINGNVITDYYFTEFGDFNYSSNDFSFLDVLSVSSHKKWQDVINTHYYDTGIIGSTVQCGVVELYSEEGFNFVISFKTSQGYARSYYDFATKDNLGDAWVNYITGLGNATMDTTFRYIYINTTQKYMRINCYITEGYGSMTIFNWQSYLLPIMKFNTTVLQEGDVVLIKRHHINEIPKGTNYLLNAEAVLAFGEGI